MCLILLIKKNNEIHSSKCYLEEHQFYSVFNFQSKKTLVIITAVYVKCCCAHVERSGGNLTDNLFFVRVINKLPILYKVWIEIGFVAGH